MKQIQYLKFDEIDPVELIPVLNSPSLREHLVQHPMFDDASISEWVASKIQIDHHAGCRVRVVAIDETLAGWCGIQAEDDRYEIAIVISKSHWGIGVRIFKTLMSWAQELGHTEIVFHLLDSRREYKSLAKMANSVTQSQIMGRHFTTYSFTVAAEH